MDKDLHEKISHSLKKVYDPEIPVNVYDLGLIYGIESNDRGGVNIRMTLTNPNCPVADSLVEEVRQAVLRTPGVNSATIELVFEPEWTKDKMSEAAMLELGLF